MTALDDLTSLIRAGRSGTVQDGDTGLARTGSDFPNRDGISITNRSASAGHPATIRAPKSGCAAAAFCDSARIIINAALRSLRIVARPPSQP